MDKLVMQFQHSSLNFFNLIWFRRCYTNQKQQTHTWKTRETIHDRIHEVIHPTLLGIFIYRQSCQLLSSIARLRTWIPSQKHTFKYIYIYISTRAAGTANVMVWNTFSHRLHSNAKQHQSYQVNLAFRSILHSVTQLLQYGCVWIEVRKMKRWQKN